MSDLQDLIHKTSMDCLVKGKQQERERIVKILTDKYSELTKTARWAESNYYLEVIALIRESK